MADLSTLSFTGRLTKDAAVKDLPSGKSMLQMDIALNVGFGKYENTYFIKAQKWSNCEGIAPYLLKGARVAGTGTLKISEWDSREGKHYTDLIVDLLDIILVGSAKQDGTPAKAEKAAQDTADIEDIIF